MATLSDLLAQKADTYSVGELNLEQGEIYSFVSGNQNNNFAVDWCWQSQGRLGTAVLEIWGAGGSSSRQCCCAAGLPGNSGAYSKKTFDVDGSSYITGVSGRACINSSELCCRGCSEPTSICCYVGASENGCMCAEGGIAGMSYCTCTISPYCRFLCEGYCTTRLSNDNCGLVCNHYDGYWVANAYGGDTNCDGRISCMSFLGCYGNCNCCHHQHVAGPAGMFSNKGVILTFTHDSDNAAYGGQSGQGSIQFQAAVRGVSRQPSGGWDLKRCWNGFTSCGCYEANGCYSFIPYGFGAPAPTMCSGMRDVGTAGGVGMTRIKFIEN